MRIAHPPNKHVTAPPALVQLQTTLNSLTTASSILQGFAHRNKNQHHGTRWWGPFSMLSRSIRKLLPDLESAVQRAEVLSSSSPNSSSSAKRRKTDRNRQGMSVRQPELDKFAERAQWVHDVAVAKAYEAFTQLTADKQFAQLGLVLIGVLAQVENAIAPFVQDVAEEASDAAASTKSIEVVKTSEVALPDVAPSLVLDASDYDLGVAISRDEFEKDEDLGPPIEQTNSQLTKRKKTSLQEDSEQAGEMSKERDRKKAKAGADLTNSVPKDKSKVKKKKKKRGGDEFDDLFSTLL